ncbi:MAG: arginine--tRNA ligase, partial [Planctomycetes bacterium RIFCSPHIGHO2_12_39_6]
MDYFIKDIVSILKNKIDLPEDEIKRQLEIPPDFKMGDYAFPCYSLSKALKKSPNVIASELAKTLHIRSPVVEIKATGPYLNFFLDKVIFSESVLKKMWDERERYGRNNIGADKTVVVDYSSPNIAKHLAVHHLRSALIG